MCLVFSLIFSCACYAEEIIDSISFDGVIDDVEAPVAGVETDLEDIFDLDQISSAVIEEEKVEDTIFNTESVEPVAEPVEPVSEDEKKVDEDKEADHKTDHEADHEEETDSPEVIYAAVPNDESEKLFYEEMYSLSTSSNTALYDLLDMLSSNSISINEALNEQRLLIDSIKEQLSKDSKRDSSYQKEIKQYLVAITSSLSVDLARSVSADDIHVNVNIDTVSSSSVSEDAVSDDSVSENEAYEYISTNRLYFDGCSADSIPVKLSSDEVLTVSVSNISGNEITSATEYLRNIFYVLVIMAVFLAMITAMMIEQIFFKRLHT